MVLSEQAMRSWYVVGARSHTRPHRLSRVAWTTGIVAVSTTNSCPAHRANLFHLFLNSRKLAGYVCSAVAGVHCVFYTEYAEPPRTFRTLHSDEPRKHIFTDLQHNYRQLVDKHIWRLPEQQPTSDSKRLGEGKLNNEQSSR
jgi:hypothetical protein